MFTDGCTDDGKKPESLLYYLIPYVPWAQVS